MSKFQEPIEKVDIQFLKTATGDDAHFEKDLFNLFITTIKDSIGKIKIAIEKSDEKNWVKTVHSLKGSAAAVGAFELARLLEYGHNHPEMSKKDKEELLALVEEKLVLITDILRKVLLKDKS